MTGTDPTDPAPLRVLALDIEGGYGGSSRSLYQAVRHLDHTHAHAHDRAEVEVWCRRAGPIQPLYAAIGVPCRVTPALPKVSSLARLSRNLVVYAGAGRDFLKARAFLDALRAEIDGRFDLVHFNHEALFLLARWLRPRTGVPFTMHIRTRLADTAFARWQTRLIARNVDRLVFITENERDAFARLGGGAPGTVIYNIAAPPEGPVTPHPAVPQDGRFRVASLSNFAWVRGIDRLVAVAEALAAMGRRDVLFVLAGEMGLRRSLPGALGRIGRRGGTLADFAAARGVGDMFLFPGHVGAPERVLAACHVLARPSREDNPWGRDIIEAMAMGLPVLAVGRWDRFVENGETGVLQPEFDAAALAREILRLADDRGRLAILGAAARARVADLCGGRAGAGALLSLWTATVRRGRRD